MIYDVLTGREVEPTEDIDILNKGTSFIDKKGTRYIICSISYGETKVMEYNEYIKRLPL